MADLPGRGQLHDRCAETQSRAAPADTGNHETAGAYLGRFDLPGQKQGLEEVREACRMELEALGKNRETRLRSYGTLGLCAGAALAILFL